MLIKVQIFLLLVLITTVSSKVNDKCVLDGANGLCEYLKDCPKALHELNFEGKLYTRCEAGGVEPIVCCLPSLEASVSISPENSDLPISVQKCREYGRNIKRKIFSWTLTANRETTYDSCPFAATYLNQPLISEGTKSLEKEFPHMASIGYTVKDDDDDDENENDLKVDWACGGSLISDYYVLSAAHCNNRNVKPKYLLFGVLNNKRELSPHRVVKEIETIINHPDYNADTKNNDICLYKSDSAIPFNDYIRPICLPVENYQLNEIIASGFGKTHYTKLSDVLFKVNLNNLDPVKCRLDESDQTKICAGSLNSSADTCTGDSGGPLQMRHPDDVNDYCMYVIVGITSNGYICHPRKRGKANTASVYTRVFAYLNWIECKVWRKNC